MGLTDKEKLYAAKLAYLDISEEEYQEIENDDGTPPTVQKWLKYKYADYERGIKRKYAEKQGKNVEDITDGELSEKDQETLDMLERIRKGEVLNGWKLLDTRNENRTTGFAGCLLETDTGDAVVGFRGSEFSEGQLLADWASANFALPFIPTTIQQNSAENYMQYIYEKYGGGYQSFYTVGHSLGGNLAFHAAVTGEGIYGDKLKGAYNLDGPGFTEEDYQFHGEEIDKLSKNGVLSHYAWTLVGTLFHDEDKFTQFIDSEHWDVVNGHVLESLSRNLDDNGNFKAGKVTPFDHVINFRTMSMDAWFDGSDIERLDRICRLIDTKIKENKYKKDVKEHDYENEQQIAEYLKNHTESQKMEYLVRGALLKCSCGTHARQLNLEKCHGVYVGEHPLVHSLNCETGEEKNITFFGVCKAASPPPTENVTYQKDSNRDADGNPTGDRPWGFETGHKCCPEIAFTEVNGSMKQGWQHGYQKTSIIDNSDSEAAKEMETDESLEAMAIPTITTMSFLVCSHGGLIEPYNSGQAYPLNPEDVESEKGEIHGDLCGEEDASRGEETVHAIGNSEDRYGTKRSQPYQSEYKLANEELTEETEKYIDSMLDKTHNQTIAGYQWDKIEEILQADEINADQAKAVAYVYGTIQDDCDVERFLNAGYVAGEREAGGNAFYVSYEEYNSRESSNYREPSAVLTGVASWYERNRDSLEPRQQILGDIIGQVEGGYYTYDCIQEPPVRLKRTEDGYQLSYPD